MHLADNGWAACIDTVLGQTVAELATWGWDPNGSRGNLVWVPGFKLTGY